MLTLDCDKDKRANSYFLTFFLQQSLLYGVNPTKLSLCLLTTVYFGLLTIGALIVTTKFMVFTAGKKLARMFATFFTSLLIGYSGVLTTLPETMVRTLGLGNYQAKAIVLETSYCAKEQARVLPTNDQCVLKDVQVVWSLGEAFVLRLADGSTARLPAAAIRTLVKPQ